MHIFYSLQKLTIDHETEMYIHYTFRSLFVKKCIYVLYWNSCAHKLIVSGISMVWDPTCSMMLPFKLRSCLEFKNMCSFCLYTYEYTIIRSTLPRFKCML